MEVCGTVGYVNDQVQCLNKHHGAASNYDNQVQDLKPKYLVVALDHDEMALG